MKNFIKAISLICCLSLVLTVCVACGNKADIKPNKKGYLVGTTNNISLSDSVENDAWKLEFDPETANVLVTDKNIQKMRQNPVITRLCRIFVLL